MGTITTSTSNLATAFGNQRKIDRASNGVLWQITATTAGALRLFYSTDGGATWTDGGQVVAGTTNYAPNASIKFDEDDFLHIAYKDPADGYIRYVRGTLNAARTACALGTATTVATPTVSDHPDLVVFRDPANVGTWRGYIVYQGTSFYKCQGRSLTVAANGVVTIGAEENVSGQLASSNTNSGLPSIDFNHTGDGKTVAGGTPHLYVGWSAGATGAGYGIRFRKATYSGGSWTWGSEIEVDNAHYMVGERGSVVPGVFDGTRFVIAGQVQAANDHDLILHDVNVTTLAVTARTLDTQLTAVNPTRAIRFGSTSYDTLGNVYIFGTSATGAPTDVAYRKWDRAAGTLGPRVSFDSTGRADPWVSARRGPAGQAIDYVYTDGTASPYTVTSGRIVLNQNPTAPTPVTPADNATWDSATDQTVTLPYADPDGNPASKVRVYYRPKGTSAPFAVLEQNTTVASGSNVNVTVPAGTWPGEIQYYGQFADSSGAWSDPGPMRTVTGIPAGLAALTGGGGGTAFSAWTISNATENARIQRIGGRTALATIASTSPLLITVEGGTVSASRSAGYTPTQGDTVQADYVSSGWIVQDKVV